MEDVVEEEPTRQSSRRGGIQAKENIQKKVKFSDVATERCRVNYKRLGEQSLI